MVEYVVPGLDGEFAEKTLYYYNYTQAFTDIGGLLESEIECESSISGR